jgi:zinc transporter ZupT
VLFLFPLQGCAFALYGLFFNISKLNKAVATMLVALLNMLCLPAAYIKLAVKRISKAIGDAPHKCVDKMMGPEWVSGIPFVLVVKRRRPYRVVYGASHRAGQLGENGRPR